MFGRFIFIPLLMVAFFVSSVFAERHNPQDGDIGQEIANSVLEGINGALDEIGQNLLILIIPDETGKYILKSGKEIYEISNLSAEYATANFYNVLSEKMKDRVVYKNIILQIGPDVSYKYLYNKFISVIDDYLVQNYDEEVLGNNFLYQLNEPFSAQKNDNKLPGAENKGK